MDLPSCRDLANEDLNYEMDIVEQRDELLAAFKRTATIGGGGGDGGGGGGAPRHPRLQAVLDRVVRLGEDRDDQRSPTAANASGSGKASERQAAALSADSHSAGQWRAGGE